MPRPRTSEAEQELSGGYKTGKVARRRRPDKVSGKPTCPKILQGEARREWERVTAELAKMGVLEKTHRSALVQYCENWAVAQAAFASLRDDGILIEESTAAGNTKLKPNPAQVMLVTSTRVCEAFRRQFGLTVKSNQEMDIGTGGEDDALDELYKVVG